MRRAKLIVIGGGASGMMAAISAAKLGAEVTILEHKDKLGKKILSTGNGKCNFTNEDQNISHYHARELEFVQTVLRQFDYNKTLDFFMNLGIIPKKKNGYYYPNSNQASSILDVLLLEINRLGIKVITDCEIKTIDERKGFVIYTNVGRFNADRIIISTGSKAASHTGSDGSGYDIAKEYGHRIRPVLPALVQLQCRGKFFKKLAGVRSDAKISLYVDGNMTASDTGELQLTDYGISGIPVFQISRFASIALYEKKSTEVLIDFLPDMDETEVKGYLISRLMNKDIQDINLEDALIGMLNKKLIYVIIKEAGLDPVGKNSDITLDDIDALIRNIKAFKVLISASNSFDKAQVCTGGVDCGDIDAESLESKIVPGLYFAGELLDVDGDCGGYNLQWAWSSGYVAGIHAAKEI